MREKGGPLNNYLRELYEQCRVDNQVLNEYSQKRCVRKSDFGSSTQTLTSSMDVLNMQQMNTFRIFPNLLDSFRTPDRHGLLQ